MSALRWWSALLLVLAGVSGAALLLQRQAAEGLRAEIALLREENRELVRLRAENRRLVAAQVSAAELARLRDDRAAVERLRAEVDAVKDHTDALAREAELAARPLIPAAEWRNAGRATPAATVETLLWTAANHDAATLASLLAFDARLRPTVGAFFEALPETLRTRYGTPERLCAEFMARDLAAAAMRIIDERSAGADDATLVVRLRNSEGFTRVSPFALRRSDAGWQLLVPPATLQAIANELGSQMPSPP